VRLPLACAALGALAGCGGADAPAAFEHYPAVERAIARLEAEVAAQERAEPPPAARELEREHVPGLVRMLAHSSGRARELPLEEVRALGDAATPTLAALAAGAETAPEERAAACELLGEVASQLATSHLLELCEKAPEAWLRAHAAFQLGRVGRDHVLPRVLRRLKYEADQEVVVWLASAAAAYRNYAGLEALWMVRNAPRTTDLSALAEERLAAIAQEAGVADPDEHYQLWFGGDPEGRLPAAEPSARLRLEAWRRIRDLRDFQLRGVDDGRFVLSRLGTWIVDPLCEALHDDDRYVRVHAAQCLERMGPRALAAGPTLLTALSDPTLAIDAAAALGGVAYPGAEPALRELLTSSRDHELRVAAARALGRLGLAVSIPALRAVVEGEEPLDLRQAGATSMVQAGAGDEVALRLLAMMSDPAADRPAAEAALEQWLSGREDAVSRAVFERWLALAPPPGIIPTAEEVEQRLARRAELLRAIPR